MQDTASLSVVLTPPRLKRPLTSVMSPFKVPLIITDAPMTGSPFSSMTVPLMSMVWADASENIARSINKNTKNLFIRSYY